MSNEKVHSLDFAKKDSQDIFVTQSEGSKEINQHIKKDTSARARVEYCTLNFNLQKRPSKNIKETIIEYYVRCSQSNMYRMLKQTLKAEKSCLGIASQHYRSGQ